MTYNFESIYNFIKTFEIDLMNMLEEYGTLDKLSPDAKKIIFYLFLHNFDKKLSDSGYILYFTKPTDFDIELFHYINKDKFLKFILKICKDLKRYTGKVISFNRPIEIKTSISKDDMDGPIIEEINLLEYRKPVDPKMLKQFLESHSLGDLFKSISKKIY